VVRGIARDRADLLERIVAAEAKAAEACRNHDATAEWEAECVCWVLYEQAAEIGLPLQRDAT
jgi:hypothetical protein